MGRGHHGSLRSADRIYRICNDDRIMETGEGIGDGREGGGVEAILRLCVPNPENLSGDSAFESPDTEYVIAWGEGGGIRGDEIC